jgi:oligopeptide transport system permease protein
MAIDDNTWRQLDERRQLENVSSYAVGPDQVRPEPSLAGIELGVLAEDQVRGGMTQAPSESVEPISERKSPSPFAAALRRFSRDRRAMICLVIFVGMVVFSFAFPYFYVHIGSTILAGVSGNKVTPPEVYHDFTHQELYFIDVPPSSAYPLGADQLGRDIFARMMAGVQVSVEVTLLVMVLDIGLGLLIGTLAAYYGGWIDTLLARFTDLMFAFPSILFAILMAATLGDFFSQHFGAPGRLILVSLAFGLTLWPFMARYVRGQTLQIKEQQYIEAARTVGSSNRRIIMRHVVPNLFNIVLTAATLDMVGVIIGEATLSLLGLGVQNPGSSLGRMIFDGSRRLYIQPTEVLWPVIVLAVLVLCLSFVADGIADAFNPRSKD